MITYEEIFDRLIASESDVHPGLMMREPALKCNGSVFAFYYQDKDAMCFKLGKGYPIQNDGISEFSHLDPFKNKPPMTAWYIVGRDDQQAWPMLTEKALAMMRGSL